MKRQFQVGVLRKASRLAALASVLLVLVMGLLDFGGCGNQGYSSERIGVVVSIMPQAEFAESVGGDKVDITVMVPQKSNPHTYEPKTSQMRALSNAGIYAKVGSGIEFELAWMDKLVAVNQKMLVVDCSKGIQLIEMTAGDTHEGEPQGAMDPHIWTSPLNAGVMVQNISDGLVQVDPGNKAHYERNRDLYLQKLNQLDKDIRDGLSRVKNRKFLVYHPGFGYFAKEYNLTMLSIEEQGKEPTAAGMARLIQQARDNNIKVVFASPQFNPQSAKVIAEAIGGRVMLIDNLARDYISNMRSLLAELVQVME